MTAQTFIFVHDEQIVLDYIEADKFSELPDVRYVFLGQRPVERIKDLDNVVIARHLPDNIEHLPNLVAWTGWYAVAFNGLITADIVNLFEYDINVSIWKPSAPSAYFWHPYADDTWWNYNGIRPELRRMEVKVSAEPLPMTSNYSLFVYQVHSFLTELMASDFDFRHQQAGHIIERYCSAYFQFKVFAAGGLNHLYADSHGTQGRGDRYEQIKSRLL